MELIAEVLCSTKYNLQVKISLTTKVLFHSDRRAVKGKEKYITIFAMRGLLLDDAGKPGW